MFPYIVLIIFFGRAVTLRGMEDGIAHLFTPKVMMTTKEEKIRTFLKSLSVCKLVLEN